MWHCSIEFWLILLGSILTIYIICGFIFLMQNLYVLFLTKSQYICVRIWFLHNVPFKNIVLRVFQKIKIKIPHQFILSPYIYNKREKKNLSWKTYKSWCKKPKCFENGYVFVSRAIFWVIETKMYWKYISIYIKRILYIGTDFFFLLPNIHFSLFSKVLSF